MCTSFQNDPRSKLTLKNISIKQDLQNELDAGGEVFEAEDEEEDDDDIPDEWKDDGEIHLVKRCQRMIQVSAFFAGSPFAV